MERQAIKKLALKILRENGIEYPPIDLLKIADSINALVFLSSELPYLLDGSTSKLKDGRPLILINTRRIEGRKIFTLAHELGHIFLNHWDIGLFEMSLYDRDNPIYKKAERQADIFATEILMPAPMVKRVFYKQTQNVKELAELFLVSQRAIEIRLQELGLVV